VTPTQTDDASFFALVHDVLGGEKPRAERAPRHAFNCLQLIAPVIDGEQLPDQSQFKSVECQDLSPTGFSYISDEPPPHWGLVVALGRVPFIFLTAQIVRHQAIGMPGQERYVVGCRFTGRIGS